MNRNIKNLLCLFTLKFCFGQRNAGKKVTKRKGGILIPKWKNKYLFLYFIMFYLEIVIYFYSL